MAGCEGRALGRQSEVVEVAHLRVSERSPTFALAPWKGDEVFTPRPPLFIARPDNAQNAKGKDAPQVGLERMHADPELTAPASAPLPVLNLPDDSRATPQRHCLRSQDRGFAQPRGSHR